MPESFVWEIVAIVVGAITIMAPLALLGYLFTRFTPRSETEKLETEVCAKIDKLQATLEKTMEKGDKRYATLHELNGYGVRLDSLKEDLQESRAETRAAFNMAKSAHQATKNMDTRMEEVVLSAVARLEGQVRSLSDEVRSHLK